METSMYLCMEVEFTCHHFYFHAASEITSIVLCKTLLPITSMEEKYNFHHLYFHGNFHNSKLKNLIMWRDRVSMPSIGHASFGQEA